MVSNDTKFLVKVVGVFFLIAVAVLGMAAAFVTIFMMTLEACFGK